MQAQSALADASRQARFDVDAAKIRLDQATRQRDLLRQQTADLPQISREADVLTRAQTAAHKTSDQLDGAVQAAQLDQAAASGNVQIVQEAYAPDAPVRPDPKRDLLVGAGVGLALSLLVVFLLEQADRSVRTAADVRRLADGPIVAVLPQMTRSERGRLLKGETPPEVIESYNAARANLGLAFRQRGGDRPGRPPGHPRFQRPARRGQVADGGRPGPVVCAGGPARRAGQRRHAPGVVPAPDAAGQERRAGAGRGPVRHGRP